MFRSPAFLLSSLRRIFFIFNLYHCRLVFLFLFLSTCLLCSRSTC